ncbi:phosphotransferase [Salinibacterium sp. SYSU T00001]|uniref:phosphotransferase n=1 Tax=Homoserinimonas sedimenticola TaxID=2986805 RepID=UPI002236035C|nr:phosphotransferase [Salinibacterium sedimenticola]MCW4386524.1 phosphotransferase [Salinibacterium sedimenticola]
MARSLLTLAALATAAVEGLDAREVGGYDAGDESDFDSAVVTGADGRHWVVRVAKSERAEAEQSQDLLALRALSVGVRGRLPFEVTRFAGQTPVGTTRAVVTEFVYGDRVRLDAIPAGEGLATSIGRAIAAIHTLPTSFVGDAGLPVHSPQESLRSLVSVLDRASATNLVPVALLRRWERATEDSALWQFLPTVINGALTADSFLRSGNEVSGITGWHALSVDDPARDLAWLLSARNTDVAESALDAYQLARGSSDRQIAQRARLYSELELAKWLLHGSQLRDSGIVDDAVAMLHNLVDRVEHDMDQTIAHNTMPVLAVDEVEAMLDERERRGDANPAS